MSALAVGTAFVAAALGLAAGAFLETGGTSMSASLSSVAATGAGWRLAAAGVFLACGFFIGAGESTSDSLPSDAVEGTGLRLAAGAFLAGALLATGGELISASLSSDAALHAAMLDSRGLLGQQHSSYLPQIDSWRCCCRSSLLATTGRSRF